MNRLLEERTLLISGAAGTLGRAAASACVAAGATVVLVDKNLRGLERLYDEIMAADASATVLLYPLDLEGASEADFAELAERVEAELGGLHGILHAANDAGVLGPIVDLGAREVERALKVNCSAPLQLTRAVLPLLNRTGDASIVFVSDTAARAGKAYWGAYGISKMAMEGLATILAEETAAAGKVRIHTFLPGPYRSPVYLRAFPGSGRTDLPEAGQLCPKLIELLAAAGTSLASGRPIPNVDTTGQVHVR
ncbi:SDR family NAD(P)-dependent oxidoreductase [Methylotetracoccus oryzae]|uniref:SDR family NAD(P)-dependent oxidoreductase n=1 Tax=Methylotetracoccus oryzae TaxID=1919059 RepID=UPI0011182AE8|nr:SDR family NAD(P)-dependent oxidoreductase [Methylotetracoccus oryzae]